DVPDSVVKTGKQPGAAPFSVAKAAPTVELAFHANLGPNAVGRRLWSSWGDICLARDGKVYSAIGDHGDDAGGDARCFLYVWDPGDHAPCILRENEPRNHTADRAANMNKSIPQQPGRPPRKNLHPKHDQGRNATIK